MRRAIASINKLEHVWDQYRRGPIHAKKSVFNICSSAALICYDQINKSSAAGVRHPTAAREWWGNTHKEYNMLTYSQIHTQTFLCMGIVVLVEGLMWNQCKMVLKESWQRGAMSGWYSLPAISFSAEHKLEGCCAAGSSYPTQCIQRCSMLLILPQLKGFSSLAKAFMCCKGRGKQVRWCRHNGHF